MSTAYSGVERVGRAVASWSQIGCSMREAWRWHSISTERRNPIAILRSTTCARRAEGRPPSYRIESSAVKHATRDRPKTARRVDLMAAYLESLNNDLVPIQVGEVLAGPQCHEMEKPSTDVIYERRHLERGTKTGTVTIVLHPLSELSHMGYQM